MPRKAIDYNKTIIYKLVKNDDFDNSNVYIGSTTDFIRRKSQHKSICHNENNKEYNRKVYENIRQNGGWSEWDMLEIEKYPCNDKREAEAREEWWRCEFNARLNTIRPFTTEEQKKEESKQYYKEHAEEMKQYRTEHAVKIKQYRTEHAEEMKQYNKEYRTENAEKLNEQRKQYRTEHAVKIKQYRTQHAEEIKQYNKEYRTENAKKLHQKYNCDCGSVYIHTDKSRHLKSKKHQNYINNKIEMI